MVTAESIFTINQLLLLSMFFLSSVIFFYFYTYSTKVVIASKITSWWKSHRKWRSLTEPIITDNYNQSSVSVGSNETNLIIALHFFITFHSSNNESLCLLPHYSFKDLFSINKSGFIISIMDHTHTGSPMIWKRKIE